MGVWGVLAKRREGAERYVANGVVVALVGVAVGVWAFWWEAMRSLPSSLRPPWLWVLDSHGRRGRHRTTQAQRGQRLVVRLRP